MIKEIPLNYEDIPLKIGQKVLIRGKITGVELDHNDQQIFKIAVEHASFMDTVLVKDIERTI